MKTLGVVEPPVTRDDFLPQLIDSKESDLKGASRDQRAMNPVQCRHIPRFPF